VCFSLALAVSFASSCLAANGAGSKPAVDLLLPPTVGHDPVEISVGLYITNLVAIDETRETFEVGGFLTGRWHDPRLALPGNQPGKPRTFHLGDIWAPAIEGANTISHTTNQYSLEADSDGTVTYRERFEGVYSNSFALKRFPFDTQVLSFEFQPFLTAASPIRFASEALRGSGITPDQHTELAAWQLGDLTYAADKLFHDPFQPETHEALFQIAAKRRSGFYLWKIFLPLVLITLVPMVVFWIDVKEFDWIVKIPMTMLLSMVAFELAITRDLPRVGYITFLDAVFVTGFALCFLCILEILTVYLIYNRGLAQRANRIHASGRWLYPLTYFGVLALLALFFF
jgi:Neurotransmitter-gated ion-channel ligand binding domain